MSKVTRREFLGKTSFLAAAVPSLSTAQRRVTITPTENLDTPSAANEVRWLEEGRPRIFGGAAFGVPWPMGLYPKETELTLQTPDGNPVPLQSWTTATWPDGSLKWTGHALAPDAPAADHYQLLPGEPSTHTSPVRVKRTPEAVKVDTGVIECSLPLKGQNLLATVDRRGSLILTNGRLTGSRQNTPDAGSPREVFSSEIRDVAVEQSGPVRAVVKVDGLHLMETGREWLPFSVRFYFHAGSDDIRLTHTFVFDGDEHNDFISGLGLRFEVAMRDAPYNRHVRFAGQGQGLWGESVQGLTGLRIDPGEAVTSAQVAGKAVPDIRSWPEQLSSRIHWVPTWGDFTLSQGNANGFSIKKRTKPGHGWVPADQGSRSNGLGYVGGTSGGVVFGMRDFWKLHPTQLDIRDASTGTAEVTLWIWSPEAPAMDIRFYHDGLGQDITGPLEGVTVEGIEPSVPDLPYQKQVDALRVTYEDYEPGFGTPHGIARSTDLFLKVVDSTPARDELVRIAETVSNPPQLIPRPEDMLRARVFSNMWGLPNRSSATLSAMEDRLNWSIQFYKNQVEQRQWYGFWDYGDVMHTYDPDRHVWRYDVGGFAWDNSELSTDMWLWYTFIRSGDPDAFRLAEAMNRHNRDVDIYHLGRFAGFGTRHNVQHWGCSAKQLRISTCMNRRFHYFLTTDERTGDVLQEVVEADRQLANLNARRKVTFDPTKPEFFEPQDSERCRISVGTDYGAAVSNWLTAWERSGDPKYRSWIEDSMRAIGNSKWGFFTNRFWYDPQTKAMTPPEEEPPMASHLSIMFGLPEVVAELIQLFDIPEFNRAWFDYCTLWNAPREVLDKELGKEFKAPGFPSSHSRITAYAAVMNDDDELAVRAAREFLDHRGKDWKPRLTTDRIEGPHVLNPVDEATWVSTNQSAQWGLGAISNSALVPDALSQHRR